MPLALPTPRATLSSHLRSGWTPPKDCGLWTVSGSLRQAVLSAMTPLSRSYWEAENSYFDQITSISGGSV